jgi:hypothetical protein
MLFGPASKWELYVAAEVGIYGDVPRFQQPFRDVAPISVSLAPTPKLGRDGVLFRC